MIKLFNPWVILGAIFVLSIWTGVVYNKGWNDREAEYNLNLIEQLENESEVADEISNERADQRKETNKTEREIKNEAEKFKDAPASPRLQSISDGLWRRWYEDHK